MIVTPTPDSSNISGHAFDAATGNLTVEFQNGGQYTYVGVTPEAFKEFSRSNSPGRALSSVIKPNFKFEKLGDDSRIDMRPPKVTAGGEG